MTTKDDGRPGVVAWLALVDGAQRPLAKRLDMVIRDAMPKAVSGIKYRKPSQPQGVPFYGLKDKGWYVHMNALKGRMRVTFLVRGLKPKPPIDAPGGTGAIDIASLDELDEKQLTAWVKAASQLPGWGTIPADL